MITVFGDRYKKIGADDEMVPPWASFEFDPRNWWDLLVQYKIDDAARHNLLSVTTAAHADRM